MAENINTPTPTRGVPVMLDKERRLRYTFRTRRELIEKMGGDEKKLAASLTGGDLPMVLWYGLKHEDPDLTVEQLEEMVDFENLEEVVTAMSKALGYKEKPKVMVTGENPPTAAAETSASSRL